MSHPSVAVPLLSRLRFAAMRHAGRSCRLFGLRDWSARLVYVRLVLPPPFYFSGWPLLVNARGGWAGKANAADNLTRLPESVRLEA